MAGGLETTFRLLRETPNEAAVAVLDQALDSELSEVREAAFQALLERKSAAGRQRLLQRWPELPDRWRQLMAERHAGSMTEVLQAAVRDSSKLSAQACEAAVWLRDFEMIPVLATAVEDPACSQRKVAGQALLDLADQLRQELRSGSKSAAGRSGTAPTSQDPHLQRPHLVGHLAASVDRYDRHQRREIVEAFLLLCQPDSGPLARMLRDPQHPAQPTLLECLRESPRVGLLELLVQYLKSPQAAGNLLDLIGLRCDLSFLRQLFRSAQQLSPECVKNLKRIKQLAWTDQLERLTSALGDEEQFGAVQLAAASGLRRAQIFAVVAHFLTQGCDGGRRAAIVALADFKGEEANRLTEQAIGDHDPEVQAAALSQLRVRGLAGAITRLIEFLDSPHDQVRRAAQQCLSEFNFRRFITAFDSLDEQARLTTGALVKRIDPGTAVELTKELESDNRSRRIRGLKVAVALGLVAEVEEPVRQALLDPDHFIRVEAATALGDCDTLTARQALRDALLDKSTVVRIAAEESLQQLAQQAVDSGLPGGVLAGGAMTGGAMTGGAPLPPVERPGWGVATDSNLPTES